MLCLQRLSYDLPRLIIKSAYYGLIICACRTLKWVVLKVHSLAQ